MSIKQLSVTRGEDLGIGKVFTGAENVNLKKILWKWGIHKNKQKSRVDLQYQAAIALLSLYTKNSISYHIDTCTPMLMSVIFTLAWKLISLAVYHFMVRDWQWFYMMEIYYGEKKEEMWKFQENASDWKYYISEVTQAETDKCTLFSHLSIQCLNF